MGSSRTIPLRALPRTFVTGIDLSSEAIELPLDERKKLRNVLRLSDGDQIAILPNDGSILRCVLQGNHAWTLERTFHSNLPSLQITLAQALPKGEKLDDIVRMSTELGVRGIILFPSDRSIVKWDHSKLAGRMARLNAIAREASEVCFRTTLPEIQTRDSLASVLDSAPDAIVLNESQDAKKLLSRLIPGRTSVTLVIGPEGGWSPKENEAIGDRSATLGPLVFRVDTAAVAAIAMTLALSSDSL